MGFKPPLPTDELRQIQKCDMESADVRALLWEIKRMRATLLYADQLQRMLTTLPGPQGAILDTLREKLKEEPCVKEFLDFRQVREILFAELPCFCGTAATAPCLERAA